MERFYLEAPSLKRKEEAINYINEFYLNNSRVNGAGSLDHYLDTYEEWLEFLEKMKSEKTCPQNFCPGFEYFLIRENDNKLVGMINLRYNLNEVLLKHGGNIGYGIRPSERRKGYNKIQLYLCLLEAQKIGIEKVLLTAADNNLGSVKTILSLGGVLENKIEEDNELMGRYWIDVSESIENNKKKYNKYIKRK